MTTTKVEATKQPGLIAKLSTIMGELKDIPKAGFNEHQHYAFRKADDVDAAVSKELSKHNVILWFTCFKQTLEPLYKTANGSTMWIATVEVGYQFIDGETGETTPVSMVPGTGADTGDKAHAKAMTMSKKYFLGQVFLIGGNDDPEADEKTDKAAAAAGASSGRRTTVTKANNGTVGKGGRSERVTDAQLAELKRLAKDLGVPNAAGMMTLVKEALTEAGATEIPEWGTPEEFSVYLRGLTSTQMGAIIVGVSAQVDAAKEHETTGTDESSDDDTLDLG